MASFGLTTCLPEDQGVPASHDYSRDPEASNVRRAGRWKGLSTAGVWAESPSCSETTVLQSCPGMDTWGTGYQP